MTTPTRTLDTLTSQDIAACALAWVYERPDWPLKRAVSVWLIEAGYIWDIENTAALRAIHHQVQIVAGVARRALEQKAAS